MSSEPSREELLQQLANAIQLRSSQDQVLWGIHGVFWASNSILLVALFANGKIPTPNIGTILSSVGLFMSLTWYFMQRRALGHVKRHEALMARIDLVLFKDSDAMYGITYEADYKKYLSGRPRARSVMPAAVIIFMIVWTIGLMLSLWAWHYAWF
jgi:hypothetical protein